MSASNANDSQTDSKTSKRKVGGNAGKGRVLGVPNKLTGTIKEHFEAAFNYLQRDPEDNAHLRRWAHRNPDKFYALTQKLIPAAIEATIKGDFVVDVKRDEVDL